MGQASSEEVARSIYKYTLIDQYGKEYQVTGYSERLDGKTLEQVYLAPLRQELTFDIQDGYVNAIIPFVNGYSMIVFEE